SWNLNYFTPTSGDNVLNIRHGSDFMVYIPSAALDDVYFPVEDYIQTALAISSSDDFSIVLSVTNRYDSAADMQLQAPSGWTIKERLGSGVTDAGNYVVKAAESVTVMMVRV